MLWARAVPRLVRSGLASASLTLLREPGRAWTIREFWFQPDL
jgi:hypothetical protein